MHRQIELTPPPSDWFGCVLLHAARRDILHYLCIYIFTSYFIIISNTLLSSVADSCITSKMNSFNAQGLTWQDGRISHLEHPQVVRDPNLWYQFCDRGYYMHINQGVWHNNCTKIWGRVIFMNVNIFDKINITFGTLPSLGRTSGLQILLWHLHLDRSSLYIMHSESYFWNIYHSE